MEIGSKHEAQVLHNVGDFVVVSLGDTAHVTIVPLTAHLNETFLSESDRPKPGDTLRGKVVVMEPTSEALNGLPLVNRDVQGAPKAVATPRRRGRTTSEGRGSLHSFRCGEVVTTVVSCIKPMEVNETF